MGSPHIADFIRTHRDLLTADLVITSDGPLPDDRHPTIEFGVRGVIGFELRRMEQIAIYILGTLVVLPPIPYGRWYTC